MSQKLKNINLYLPHERERTSGSREKQTFHLFLALLKLSFNIVDLYLERLLPQARISGHLGQLIAHRVSALQAPLV